MTTPIADFVRKYAESSTLRFHMPGHKGVPIIGCEPFDITEIKGADVLYSANGIIEESENNASELFRTKHSFYSTEGSSLAIKAMLAIIKKRSKNPDTIILAARNVHKSFIYACALLDISAKWIYPEHFSHLCECNITPTRLTTAIESLDTLPDAVYITSPDYLGNIADIKALSVVCRKFGLPLIVDNAHGAYLAFCEPSMHPIALGADMCCDSAHKTLPVLTGGAYLHISGSFDVDKHDVRNALSLFASTSPSYLVLQSLDLCNSYLCSSYRSELSKCLKSIAKIKLSLTNSGMIIDPGEPLKIVLKRNICGYSGHDLAKMMRKYGIEPEFADSDTLILMITPALNPDGIRQLEDLLLMLKPRKNNNTEKLPTPDMPLSAMSVRYAVLSDSEYVPTALSEGRICATPTVSCPPAVPVVMSGEIITRNSVELMLHYGIDSVEVVKQNFMI